MTADPQVTPDLAVLPQPRTPCQARLDTRRSWATTLAVRTGSLIVGVRADTAGTASVLEDLLGPLRTPGYDGSVLPNFSVELGGGTQGRLCLVYRDHEIAARRRDAESLLGDLVMLLDDLPRMLVTRWLAVHASAVVTREGDVVLVPGRLHRALLTRRTQLEREGLCVLPSRIQLVEQGPAVFEPGPVDEGLAGVHASMGWARRGPTRRPVRVWCPPAVGDAPFDLRPVEGVFAGFNMVVNRQAAGMRRTLDELGAAVRRCRFVALPELTAGALAKVVGELAG